MLNSLFVFGVLGVLLVPVQCQLISVCIEEDQDLRVDCRIEPNPNRFDSYEFSWSSGNKEQLINSNVSGLTAESQFKESYVTQLPPHGFRMTLPGFTDKLSPNTTYMCKISGRQERITMEKDQVLPCSAVSVFLKSSCTWILALLFLHHAKS